MSTRVRARLVEVLAKVAGTGTILLLAHEDAGLDHWIWPVTIVLKGIVVLAVLEGSRRARRFSAIPDVASFIAIAAATTSPAAHIAILGGMFFLVLRQPPDYGLVLSLALVAGDAAFSARGGHSLTTVGVVVNGAWLVPLAWITGRRREETEANVARLELARAKIFDDVTTADSHALLTLGADIHDGPLQLLVTAVQELGESDDPAAARGEQLIRDAVGELRDILRASARDDSRDHVEAMLGSWLTVLAARGRFDWSLDIDPAIDTIGPIASASARELITNAAKHSRCHSISAAVRRDPEGLEVEVVDDGTGLPDGADAGFGLTALRRRVELSGGTLELGSGPDGAGTRAVAHVPLAA